MKKWIMCSVLAVLILICVLSFFFDFKNASLGTVSIEDHWADVMQMYQTSTAENDENYSGLLSGIRTGGYRNDGNGGNNQFECTENGVDFNWVGLNATYQDGIIQSRFLFYADHESDTVIKLCGRPDCTHTTTDCNAVFLTGDCGISYYGGHLYFMEFSIGPELFVLYRMDPDGSNRVKVLDGSSINDGQYSYFMPHCVYNGVFIIQMTGLDEITGEQFGDYYYYKLDGSMETPKPMTSEFTPEGCSPGVWTDGKAILFGKYVSETDGVTKAWQLFRWDPDSNTVEVLATLENSEVDEWFTYKCYWGENNGLANHEGRIVKIRYPDCEMEVLFETGITGDVATRFYPDCIVIHEQQSEESDLSDKLYFFSYSGKLLGELVLDIPINAKGILLGESRDVIYLQTNFTFMGLPNYYIDKSEFGTGNMELYPLKHPDLTEAEVEKLFNGGNPLEN